MADTDPIVVNFTIADPALIAGVVFARDLYNALLPDVQDKNADGSPKVDADNKPVYVAPKPGALGSAEYIMFVGSRAIQSYARQKIAADFEASQQKAQAAALADAGL
ncbi:MAG: hypothetical protein HYS06_05465 [Methylocystis sp.]|nr:hypothetical protein [Methylocystis sp.]